MAKGQALNPKEKIARRMATLLKIPIEKYYEYIDAGYKYCPACQQWLPLKKFANDKSTTGGKYCYCKVCWSTKRRAQRIELSLSTRRWRKKNPETVERYVKSPSHKYSYYKSIAKRRGLSWELSLEEFMLFWQQPCIYCKDPIATIGLDRKNNDLGYSKENCVACCKICNRMKKEYELEYWFNHMRKVLQYAV